MLRMFATIENSRFFRDTLSARNAVWNRGLKSVVFVLGGPGSGKGTVCETIAKEFRFKHISAGEILREELNRPSSEHSHLIRNCMMTGSIIPSNITCNLLEKAVSEATENNILIDGFPRNKENLFTWKSQEFDNMSLRFVLFLECPDEVCAERCLKRGMEENRIDDNMQSLKSRFHFYLRETMPVIDFFECQGSLVRVRSDRKQNEVSEDVAKIFEEYGFKRCRAEDQ